MKGLNNKLRIVFGHPALLDQDIRPTLEKKYLQHKPNDAYQFKFKSYLNVQIIFSTILLTFLTAFFKHLGLDDKLFIVAFILITLINCGALMEQMRWIYYLECFRMILAFGYVFFKYDWFSLILIPTIILIVLERIFSLSSLYKQHVLRYEKVNV